MSNIHTAEVSKYINIVRDVIVTMITNDFTIGRTDNGKQAYTSDTIDQFIYNNKDKIATVIDRIIKAYSDDDDLHLLEHPLYDWIGEFLYEEINTNVDFI